MTNLAELKAQHPEWCFTCGKWHLEAGGIHTCFENPILAALLSVVQRHEAGLAKAQETIATLRDSLQQQARELEEAQQIMGALLFPNVPSADDVALLVRMTSGSSDRADGAMLFVEALRAAQGQARAFLARYSARAQQAEAKKEDA